MEYLATYGEVQHTTTPAEMAMITTLPIEKNG